jgi:hypothetical protein
MYRVNLYTSELIQDAVKNSGGPDNCHNGADTWPWPATHLSRRSSEAEFNSTDELVS